jgi:hypothetical protein
MATRERIAELENQLLRPKGEWRQAYVKLIDMGKPGWQVICKHEFRIADDTAHLRSGLDTGGAAASSLDLFDAFYRKRLDAQLEDEAWAVAYAKSVASSFPLHQHWPPIELSELKQHYYDPKEARLPIAFLRAKLKPELGFPARNFRFPWRGSVEEQRAAIDSWIRYVGQIDPRELGLDSEQ